MHSRFVLSRRLPGCLPAMLAFVVLAAPVAGYSAPAVADPVSSGLHGCTSTTMPKGPGATRCVDAGFVILCGISASYCCKRGSDGTVSHCHALLVSTTEPGGESHPNTHIFDPNALPPLSLSTTSSSPGGPPPKGVGLPD